MIFIRSHWTILSFFENTYAKPTFLHVLALNVVTARAHVVLHGSFTSQTQRGCVRACVRACVWVCGCVRACGCVGLWVCGYVRKGVRVCVGVGVWMRA